MIRRRRRVAEYALVHHVERQPLYLWGLWGVLIALSHGLSPAEHSVQRVRHVMQLEVVGHANAVPWCAGDCEKTGEIILLGTTLRHVFGVDLRGDLETI